MGGKCLFLNILWGTQIHAPVRRTIRPTGYTSQEKNKKIIRADRQKSRTK
jgi:hypothetical protein